MSESIEWKLLPKNEWYRLEEFYEATVEPGATVPDPALSEVLVLQNENGDIYAIFPCRIQVLFGPTITSLDIDEEVEDAMTASGIEAMRQVCQQNNLDNSQVITFHTEDKSELMSRVDFTEVPVRTYVGTV